MNMLENDPQLVAQAQADPQAFAALYDRYVDRIYAYAYRQTQDAALAQDVTAVTFEKALRHIQRFRWQGKSVVAWLYRIARNEAISQLRRRKWLTPWKGSAPQAAEAGRGPETAVLHREEIARLHQALRQLSSRDQDVLTLRYLEGLSSSEVAEVLDCPIDNVYVRLHRALQRLAQQLAQLEQRQEVSYVSQ